VKSKTESSRQSGLSVEMQIRELPGDEAIVDPAVTPDKRSPAAMAESRTVRTAVLVMVLAMAGTYTWMHIGWGWVPADDGTLSQSALRVLQGQLPHRDFGEIYTGALSFIHATAFRIFGVNLMSLRICVFLFFLAWVPAVYWIALRFTKSLAAGAITLLAVAWSYPNYPAAMPSWYNLFFATFGAAALLRHLETKTRRWLIIAGICGGVSILIKVIGAYYVAGALLFLAFVEQSESSTGNAKASSSAQRPEDISKNSWFYRIFSISALLLFLATLVHVLGARLGSSELYEFVLPSTAMVGLILVGETGVSAGSRQRFVAIFRMLVPFGVGVATPMAVFFWPYARSGTLWTFLAGVSSSAASRAASLGVIRPVGTEKLVFVLPLLAVIAAGMYWDKFQGKAVGSALGLGALALTVRATQSFDIVTGIWSSVAALTPMVVLLGAVVLWAQKRRSLCTKLQRQQTVLLISLAATCSLVQFPFAAPIYLSYAIPLTLLAIVAIVSTGKTLPGTYAHASVVALYLAFAVVTLVPSYIYEITYKIGHMDTMQTPRAGGLKIEGAAFMDELAHFLRDHSPNGLMFAGNDCPELYFLSGLKNVTFDDSGAQPAEIMKAVQSEKLHLVVINDSPYFPSSVMSAEVRAEVMKRFPNSTRFGIFLVYWRQ